MVPETSAQMLKFECVNRFASLSQDCPFPVEPVPVRQNPLVSQEKAESCKSDVPLPGGGPAGDSTLLPGFLDPAASPISRPFV